jgi:hypothetical protein
VFDSRELNAEDLLSVVVLRPGTYSIVNALDGGRKAVAEPTVAYPEKTLRPLEPVTIRCGKDGMTPKKLTTIPCRDWSSASRPRQGLRWSWSRRTTDRGDPSLPSASDDGKGSRGEAEGRG